MNFNFNTGCLKWPFLDLAIGTRHCADSYALKKTFDTLNNILFNVPFIAILMHF